MTCPGDSKHRIKAKKIYPLKFKNDQGFNCFACSKKLGFQKIVAVITCGHCLCKGCLDNFCQETKTCSCGKKYKPGDVVDMVETMSSFSSHNPVEAEKYQPAFAV